MRYLFSAKIKGVSWTKTSEVTNNLQVTFIAESDNIEEQLNKVVFSTDLTGLGVPVDYENYEIIFQEEIGTIQDLEANYER